MLACALRLAALSAARLVIVTNRPAASKIATLLRVFHIRSPDI